MKRPNGVALDGLRKAAHQDIDRLFDSWPYIIDEADAPYRGDQVEAIGRQGGTHSDPTAQQAFKPNPAAEWNRRARITLGQLHTLVAQVDKIIGPANCPECGEPIGERRSKRLDGITYHDGRCYMAAYRERHETAA